MQNSGGVKQGVGQGLHHGARERGQTLSTWLRSFDSRYFQITALTTMLLFGIFYRDFPVTLADGAAVIGAGLAVQFLGTWCVRAPYSSWKSALISGLSILLLCRSNSTVALATASALAILSKFVFRWRGKHFFNPTNFGIIYMLALSGAVWVSPAQWGEEAAWIFWVVMMGLSVVYSAGRYDVSFAFLATHFALFAARVIYLGQPWPVLWHQLNNGALLIFTFFMISDPRSTPDHGSARLLFGATVAIVGYFVRFWFQSPEALLWALFLLSPLTIAFDRVWKSKRFEWSDYETRRVRKKNALAVTAPASSREDYVGLLRLLRREG